MWEQSPDGIRLLKQQQYPTKDFANFDELFSTFLQEAAIGRVPLLGIGVAGPVSGQSVTVTNLGWELDAAELCKKFSIERVYLFNDLVAHAYGVQLLPEDGFLAVRGGIEKPGARALIAAGTGLGEAILAWDGHQHIPVATEGGHCSFAPANREQLQLLDFMFQNHPHVSFERVLSGRFGFKNLFNFFLQTDSLESLPSTVAAVASTDDAGAIVQAAAEAGEPLAREVMRLFTQIYAAEAANLALKCNAVGGVYIGGGVAIKMASWIQSDVFLEAFNDKGRFAVMLSEMPIRLVTDPLNGLRGAAQGAIVATARNR